MMNNEMNNNLPKPEQMAVDTAPGCMTTGILAVGLGLLLIALAGVLFWGNQANRTEFSQAGVTVQGTVLSKHMIDNDDNPDGYYVTYEYMAALANGEQQRFTKEARISSGVYNSLVSDAPLDVTYLPDTPERSQIQGEVSGSAIASFIAGIAGLLLLPLGGWQIWSVRKKEAALQKLTATTVSRVINRWQEEDHEGDAIYFIAYEFGAGYQARMQVTADTYEQFPIGNPITVRYSETDPTLSMPVLT